MPYNHLVTRAMDADAVPESAISVLCVLLDYQCGDARDRIVAGSGETEMGEDVEYAPTSKSNAFRYSIAKLVSTIPITYRGEILTRHCKHRTGDFEFIFDSILALLEQNLSALNGLFPGSRKGVSYLLETCKHLSRLCIHLSLIYHHQTFSCGKFST
jgi:hypothetical protein